MTSIPPLLHSASTPIGESNEQYEDLKDEGNFDRNSSKDLPTRSVLAKTDGAPARDTGGSEQVVSSEWAAANAGWVHPETPQRFFGIIKWFDKYKGYGFIKKLSWNGDDRAGVEQRETSNDYFVHHSQINIHTQRDHFRYLIAGEYVEFNVTHMKPNTDRTNRRTIMASDVTGIFRNTLMYQCVHQQQLERSQHIMTQGNDWRTGVVDQPHDSVHG